MDRKQSVDKFRYSSEVESDQLECGMFGEHAAVNNGEPNVEQLMELIFRTEMRILNCRMEIAEIKERIDRINERLVALEHAYSA